MTPRRTWLLLALSLALRPPLANAQPQSSDARCEAVAQLPSMGAVITSAAIVPEGSFTPPAPAGATTAPQPIPNLPAFCRVTAQVRRSGDTDVAVEVWMPVTGWNGEFRPASSAFAGGAIGYSEMADFLRAGWATANTNRGHDEAGPWKLTDMTSGPYHLMVVQAKTVVSVFYETAPSFTFMNACGGGGSRDALQLVQDWPQDLDAAAVVGFVYDPTHHGIGQMWVYNATHRTTASYIPPGKYPIIHEAALSACDADDGVIDGVIENPPACKFDPGVLACKSGDAPNCLTAPQIDAVRRIYNPVRHAKTGRYLFAGMVPGGELGWEAMAGPSPYNYTTGFYRNQVFNDQQWTIAKRLPNFDTDVDTAEARDKRVIDAVKGDISAFIARGGKLLLMGGWNDHTLAPGSFVDYYKMILKAVPASKLKDSVRLFMVPGMDHCLSPVYTPQYDVDLNAVLREWKTSGTAPEQLVVTRLAADGREDRKRLVCAYPKIARYNGKGSSSDPANFTCVSP